ncbi:N-acetylglucosaminyl transferase [Bacteroidales bacterium]|nr:N-acetylglucosaminyl transferase [Bacteroidales bacterium]
MMQRKNIKVLISGGGTGGHIFPAIAIANAIKSRYPKVDILFVGADNRMEMEKVPAAGYPIIGLPVAGFDRRKMWKNVAVIIKLIKSILKSYKIIKNYRPDIAIGVGGYASGPSLRTAAAMGVPCLIQEQNSYAGVSNKLLAKKAQIICVAYEGMDKFFPKQKIVVTGNPIRQDLTASIVNKEEAYAFFKLDPNKKTILIIGGSLGAATINKSIMAGIHKIIDSNIQVIWQSGKFYFHEAQQSLSQYAQAPIVLSEFISRMDLAYAVADLVVSRAGASSISELCCLQKPCVLVPSPNVAEDHQTMNALALVKKGAAILIKDKDAIKELIPFCLEMVHKEDQLKDLSKNISKLSLPDAANKIVDQVEIILKLNLQKNKHE